jgi:colicin import membrane protein
MAAVVAEQRPQQPRSEQNTPAAFLLALAMHTLLVAALWISVQWNVEPAGAVVVELWGGPAAAPEPVVVAPPPPPPAPAPVKAVPEPERPNADIVLQQEKKRLEAERRLEEERRLESERRKQAEQKRREAEARRLAEEKKQLEAERKKQAEAMAQAAERRREEERREAVRKAEEARMLAQAAGGSAGGSPSGSPGGRPGGSATAGGGGDAGYVGQLIALIRPRIIFAVPENTPASIHAEFQVDLLPTGEILAVKKLKSSGLPGYDEAVERAIRRTDPFPRKRDGTVERTVIIRFRPVDAQ